jgi:cell wall-associated NlpC family hydrolase
MKRSIISAIVLAFAFMLAGPIQSADAATARTIAMNTALAQKGKPYQYGATGPNRFDCSGLTQFAYKKAHKKIPRTAQQQYNASRHLSLKTRKYGDLVFFGSSSRHITHVGIYVGTGYMVDAESGDYYGHKVLRMKIMKWWGKHYKIYYGQVR